MNDNLVSFVAHKNQENLGIGYICSMLHSINFETEIIDFDLEKEEMLEKLNTSAPLIVGFSLIFQFYLYKFKKIVSFLRSNGIQCHFTVGGHYPSLRYDDLLNYIPELDSVVRFEGEHIICELAEKIKKGEEWRKIKGIAYLDNNIPFSNDLRPLITNLDSLPFPYRPKDNPHEILGKRISYLLASRGCIRNCSFCSVRKFYSTPSGKLRRIRTPEHVVNEIEELHNADNASIFLFQDDDFVLPGKKGLEWINSFVELLKTKKLGEKILWKISCRSDEVNYELFKKMKEVGLVSVYLGIESGIDHELEIMNKQLNVKDHIEAVKILKILDLPFEYGFMLFNPYSTFETIQNNVEFLKEICGDGSAPIVFCKMVPYAGTAIEQRLIDENRLIGSVTHPDYVFLDSKLNEFYDFFSLIFNEWIHSNQGILTRLRWHRLELEILKKDFPDAKGFKEYIVFQKKIIAEFNSLFFEIFNKTMSSFQNNDFISFATREEISKQLISEKNKILEKWLVGMREFSNQNKEQN